jgi:hypothetical protein
MESDLDSMCVVWRIGDAVGVRSGVKLIDKGRNCTSPEEVQGKHDQNIQTRQRSLLLTDFTKYLTELPPLLGSLLPSLCSPGALAGQCQEHPPEAFKVPVFLVSNQSFAWRSWLCVDLATLSLGPRSSCTLAH